MTFISYAQNFEDVLLWRALRHVSQGFYIDVGAAHPDIDSVTRAFYDRGWHGINLEPVPELHTRLIAARPRDTNLCLAAGQFAAEGTVYVVAGTGLSTTDTALAAQHEVAGFDVRAQGANVLPLAEICRLHAPPAIHFLKIDAEGAEKAVLEGADFTTYRPWIVLVEATAPGTQAQTHSSWEGILLEAGYRFLWFDGLNRFYAAGEHATAMAPHFAVPVCVFDDFLRAADTEWTRRITSAEAQAAELLERSMVAEAAILRAEAQAHDSVLQAQNVELRIRDVEHRLRDAEQRVRDAEHRAHDAEQRALAAEPRARESETRAKGAERRSDVAEQRLAHTEIQLRAAVAETERLGEALLRAREDAASLRASTSWRLMAPLRFASTLTRKIAARETVTPVSQAAPPVAATPPSLLEAESRAIVTAPLLISHRNTILSAETVALDRSRTVAPAGLRLNAPTRTVHQFHSGSAVGDAITNAMLLIRAQLRALGYRSDIFVEHLDPALTNDLRPLAEMPIGADHVLILHLSMGFDLFEQIRSLPASKVLIYHNITPAQFFVNVPAVAHYAQLGREQLAALRGHVSAALADSDYNAVELRQLGFDDPRACTLLFDLAKLRRRGPLANRPANRPFTVLFVGRIVPSKGQRDLLEAFAIFRAMSAQPSRLVLIGREDGIGAEYACALHERVHALGLGENVEMAGLVSDDALHEHYRNADLYVSLSRHEGFGVPLVEAAAIGLPVLAWPAGAVAFTLGSEAGLLHSLVPEDVAVRLRDLAASPEQRADIAQAQRQALARFELSAQLPILLQALARAGAASPQDPALRSLLAANLRFNVTGHVNGTYSLAIINRTLATDLERARPGHVRLAPVEGESTDKLKGVPAPELEAIRRLASRPPHETGPLVVISQHYPVYVPAETGDLLLAYFFWEESLIPAETVALLNASFRGVLAPSQFVAKTLHDSGVSVPVHVVGYAPDLADFAALPGAASRNGSVTTFLHVSSAFPRKGVDVLIAAYALAFRAGEPVRLVIKAFPNPHNDVQAQIDHLRRADTRAPAIELIDADLDRIDLLQLYADADAMVLPTRGEGFNIPAAEAMAAGIPLIVTGHGGHMDFCADAARLLKYRLSPSLSHLAPPLSFWAEPDIHDLAAALRDIHDNRPAALAMAQTAQGVAAEVFSAAQFAHRVEQASLDTLLQERASRIRLSIVSSWGVRCGVAEYASALVEAMLDADPALDIVVLADSRTHDSQGSERVSARAVWSLGADDIADKLRVAADREDTSMLLIQHQPGLMTWTMLADVLTCVSQPDRVVAVTLHNTSNLAEIGEDDRRKTVAALAGAARVILHTEADLARMNFMGLRDNLVLIPQGAPVVANNRGERTLIERDDVTIGSCGFLLPGKGIPALVTAAGLLKPRWPKLKLLLMNADYGDEGSRQEAIRARAAAREAGMENAVELVSDFLPIEESRWRLGSCDLIVLPYEESKESSSAALRMALSAGPSVAVTPIALFDEARGVVWRLPGHDPASIAEGLARILADEDGRRSVRNAAGSWMQMRSWDKVAARTLGMMVGISVTGDKAKSSAA